MNLFSLAIPLTRLFDLTNISTSAAAGCPRFVLNASTDWQYLLAGDPGLLLVVFAYGSGFPLADAPSHQLWAIGFSNIFAIDKDVEHSHVPFVVVQVELAALEPTEQPWAGIPSPVERKAVPFLHPVAVSRSLSVHRFHEEQLEIIRRAQIAWYPT